MSGNETDPHIEGKGHCWHQGEDGLWRCCRCGALSPVMDKEAQP